MVGVGVFGPVRAIAPGVTRRREQGEHQGARWGKEFDESTHSTSITFCLALAHHRIRLRSNQLLLYSCCQTRRCRQRALLCLGLAAVECRSEAMRIDKLRLTNFRAFEDVELELDPQLTVLVGRNGAGKTAILEGLALALSASLIQSGHMQREDQPLGRSVPRLSARYDGGTPSVEACFPVRVEAVGRVSVSEQEWHRVDLVRDFARGSPAGGFHVGSGPITDSSDAIPAPGLSYVPDRLPLFVSYGTGRLWKQGRVSRAVNAYEFT